MAGDYTLLASILWRVERSVVQNVAATAQEQALMLPVGLVRGAVGQQVTVELKNGKHCTGVLTGVDPWMNLNLESARVTGASRAATTDSVEQAASYAALHIRGTMIKLVQLPSKSWEYAQDERKPRQLRE